MESNAMEFYIAPIIVFLIVVAPIWIILHYRSKGKAADGLSSNERLELDEMIEVANNMSVRIETLEAILDLESPDWRDKQETR
jgi:phage shock protein B